MTATRNTVPTCARFACCTLTLTPLLRWAVVAHCAPAGRPSRRTCPRCATPIGPHGDLGALSPIARCRRCTQRLGPPPWTLEAVTATSAAALTLPSLRALPLLGYAWWAALGIVLVFVDLAVQRLPARLSYTAAGGLLVVLLADTLHTHNWQAWNRAALGALVATAVVAACALALPALVHWGDVRYALATGAAAAWVGWLTLYLAALLATLSAALVGICLLAARRATLTTHLPQGPFWYAGTLLAVVLTT